MNKYDDLIKEIDELYSHGIKIYEALLIDNKTKKASDLTYFFTNYELWYSKALNVVKYVLPNRLEDFTRLYSNEKRKKL